MDVRLKGSKRLQKILENLPREVFLSLRGTARDVGERYLAHHRKVRMRAPPNVSGEPRPPEEGIRGTKGKEGKPGFLKLFRVELFGTSLRNLKAWIGTRNIIAVQHEKGYTRKGAMAIPLKKALTSGGRVRKPAIKWRQNRQLIRIEAPSGKTFLARRKRGGATLEFLFHLVRRVKIRPRLRYLALWKSWRLSNGFRYWDRGLRRAISQARAKAPREA